MKKRHFLQKLKSVGKVLIGLFLLVNILASELYCVAAEELSGEEGLAVINNEEGLEVISNLSGNELYAASAVLMDAATGRVLYEKNGYKEMPMASTTKIMTCIVALEYGNPDEIVTVSSYAASMPKVKLGINAGEQFKLKDLLYSLMLESHNDVAVAIAEHIGGSVQGFADLMNQKARDIGAYDTNFVTPNGLDADGHYTTAADLALIGSYAIQNQKFVEITNTASYSFSNHAGTRSFGVSNKNAFLSQMDGAFGIKTGYTGNAGYCFVGALEKDGKVFVSAVLASGWPPNKTNKWSDTRKLMSYGLSNYSYEVIFTPQNEYRRIPVENATTEYITTYVADEICVLLDREKDLVDIRCSCPDVLTAPIEANQTIGFIEIYINDKLFRELPIRTYDSAAKPDFWFCLHRTIKRCLP